jgi:hypothetical protein
MSRLLQLLSSITTHVGSPRPPRGAWVPADDAQLLLASVLSTPTRDLAISKNPIYQRRNRTHPFHALFAPSPAFAFIRTRDKVLNRLKKSLLNTPPHRIEREGTYHLLSLSTPSSCRPLVQPPPPQSALQGCDNDVRRCAVSPRRRRTIAFVASPPPHLPSHHVYG